MEQEHTRPEAESKDHLRQRMRRLRAGVAAEERKARSQKAAGHVHGWIARRLEQTPSKPLTVLGFASIGDEIETYELLNRLLLTPGVCVALPKADRMNRQMEAYAIDRLEELEPGAYGILEPAARPDRHVPIEAIDVVLVPGLAFDRFGGRLGYGAGFYDRFFRRFQREGRPMPLRIGLGFAAQLADRVPMDAHDVALDYVVTEDGWISPPASQNS